MSQYIRALFFDLDGTLVNTYEADFLAYRDAIRQVIGVDISWDDFMLTHGMEAKFKLAMLAPGASIEDIAGVRSAKKEYYKKYIDLTIPNEELILFAHNMRKSHIIVLVTTAKRQNAELVLRRHGLDKIFKYSVFGDEIINPKPNPEAYKLALHKVGLSADQVLAFEDSKTGHDAAHAAGISTINIEEFNEN